ncbi:MAG: hypothetical protein L3J63_03855, partial [Geopsychrobacter sp.]|nr:hypothetical protein [Geopsychrobacter sp.]
LSDQPASGGIPLYLFDYTRVLQRGNDGVFIAPQDARTTIDPNPEMLQGYLEGSNVNVMQEMARMVSNTRAFESSQKALTAYGKIGRQVAELGRIQ